MNPLDMRSKAHDWPTLELSPLKILLDPQNPRIDATAKTSQNKLRELLAEQGEVLELATSIASDGLSPTESIIVVKEDGKDVVLEGNRRVCACQFLLDPSYRPTGHRRGFPVITDDIGARITRIRAVRAPTREAADRLITKKHTESGVLEWTPVAKQRRITRLLTAGRTVKEIAEQFGMTTGNVLKLVREFNVLDYVRKLKCWSKADRERLDNPRLEVNPFTRFFTLKGAKEPLGITFDKDGGFASTLNEEILDEALECLASELLLGGEDRLNTRATASEIFDKIFDKKPHLLALVRPSGANGGSQSTTAPQGPKVIHRPPGTTPPGVTTPPNPGAPPNTGSPPTSGPTTPSPVPPRPKKPDAFFETLTCHVQDQGLIRLSREIASINLKTHPTAAAFLLRALVERVLFWCIEQKGMDAEFRASLVKKTKGQPPSVQPPSAQPPSAQPPSAQPPSVQPPSVQPPSAQPPSAQQPSAQPPPAQPPEQQKDPGIEAAMRFCLTHHTRIFAESNVQRVLNHLWTDTSFLNMVVHARWMLADEQTLKSIANRSRPVLQKILDNKALLPLAP